MGRQFSTRTRRSNINMAISSVILAIFLASIIDLTTSKPQPQSYEVLDCPAVRPDLGSACSYQEEELELVCDYGVNECCGKEHPEIKLFCFNQQWEGSFVDIYCPATCPESNEESIEQSTKESNEESSEESSEESKESSEEESRYKRSYGSSEESSEEDHYH